MKIKIVLRSVVSVLILAAVAAVTWRMLRPQVITFDDGSKLTLLDVDYGTHHHTKAGQKSFTTPDDILVVWVRQQFDSKDWHNFQYYLYDSAGTACVLGNQTYYGNNRDRGNQVVGVEFHAFPRRSGKFYLRAQLNINGNQQVSDTKFVISNPARGSYATWTPMPLPDTEEDGDMSVTLKKLVAGARMQYTRDNDDDDDAINKGVAATFHVELNGTNASQWEPVAIETSDATSNRLDAFSVNHQEQDNDSTVTYQYGLWNDEAAWKLRVEFSKQSGFNDSELWVVSSIPLEKGKMQDFWNYGRKQNKSAPFAETDLQNLHFKLYPVRQFSDMPPNSQPQGGLTLEVTPPLPDGMRLTVVKLADDQNNDITHWDYGSNNSGKSGFYRYGLQNLDGVTNVNVTLAIHKSRFFEFTAKPEIAPAQSSDQSNQ